MSACFQKQVGKRKKTEDDENESNRPGSTTSSNEELMIIEDVGEQGRAERLNKRRKKQERDTALEHALFILQNEFEIPVDESMSRNEVIELAHVLLQSREDGSVRSSSKNEYSSKPSESKGFTTVRSNEPSTSKSSEPSTTKSVYNASTEYDSSDFEAENKIPGRPKTQARKVKEELSEGAPETTNTAMSSTRKQKVKREVTQVDSSSESNHGEYEAEDPIPTKTGKSAVKSDRKRRLEKEEDQTEDMKSKKACNLQLNKKQLESMQAKTSSLLKKTTVRLSQETSSQPEHQSKMAAQGDDDETQPPGSQELFEGETLPMDPLETPPDPEESRSPQKTVLSLGKFTEVIWPEHIPMKRTAFSRSSLKHKKGNKKAASTTPVYAPDNRDPMTYSKVILQLFKLYFRKLTKEQSKLYPSLEWGESVKPGRHMSRTVDVKGRGQDSYPWSSDSDSSDKSSLDANQSGKSKSKKREWLNKTKRSHLLRSNSNESAKGSDSDFVPETKRIQPRRIVTPRPPIRRKPSDDDDDLPDLLIASTNKPSDEASYSAATEPMSEVLPTFVDQTLAMDDQIYLDDTETFDPVDGKSETNEIQPRKRIQQTSPVMEVDDNSKDSDILPQSSGTRSTGSSTKRLKRDRVTASQESRGSEGSILDSQGDLRSFQKVRKGTFNLEMEDEDSKDMIDNLLNKESKTLKSAKVEILSSSDESDVPRKNVGRKRANLTIELQQKENENSGHESPILGSKKISQNIKSERKKTTKTVSADGSEDDIFSMKNKEKKGLRIFDIDSDNEEPKPSTSRNRIIPIIQTDTYEKKTTVVKPTKARQRRLSPDFIEEVEKIACPMCSRMFPKTVIERHAADCFGHQEVTSTTGDDDNQAPVEEGNYANVTREIRPDAKRNRGENSNMSKKTSAEVGEATETPVMNRVKPITPNKRPMERCCVCHKLVPDEEIEKHTEDCIQTRLEAQMEEEEIGAGDWNQTEERPRATRSRAKVRQDQSTVGQDKFEDAVEIESVSSDASNDRDPEWKDATEKSETDSDSPGHFKKISELSDAKMDFNNQFKSRQVAKRGVRRGGNSRGKK